MIEVEVDLKELLHNNRDENSFTARLFEGKLFPLFFEDNNNFTKFLKMLEEKSNENLSAIKDKVNFKDCNLNKNNMKTDFSFVDGMLFVEMYDIFNYLKIKHNIKLNNEEFIKDKKDVDKTEFDCVILCKDEEDNYYFIVFEDKCYTDLKENEILRQRKWLRQLKDKNVIKDFYHYVLISYDNLKNSKDIFNRLDGDMFIITWDDIYNEGYLDSNRFYKNKDFSLYKNYGEETTRNLLQKNKIVKQVLF